MEVALNNIRPGSRWHLIGHDYEGLVWEDDNSSPKPSEDELKVECDKIEERWNKTEYQRLRKPEYPSITDQLDALFHAGVFPPEMAAQIQAVKDKYPKGS